MILEQKEGFWYCSWEAEILVFECNCLWRYRWFLLDKTLSESQINLKIKVVMGHHLKDENVHPLRTFGVGDIR